MGLEYKDALTSLISGWRDKFNAPDLPFLIVQVAFARTSQEWLEDAQTRSGLRTGAHFVDEVDYLHHNAAYDFRQ